MIRQLSTVIDTEIFDANDILFAESIGRQSNLFQRKCTPYPPILKRRRGVSAGRILPICDNTMLSSQTTLP